MARVFTIWIAVAVLAWTAVAYGQASTAPTYTLFANGEYALSVDCVGGELRLWQGADKQSGILFCEGTAETPTPKAMYTAQPLIGGVKQYYFPLLESGDLDGN